MKKSPAKFCLVLPKRRDLPISHAPPAHKQSDSRESGASSRSDATLGAGPSCPASHRVREEGPGGPVLPRRPPVVICLPPPDVDTRPEAGEVPDRRSSFKSLPSNPTLISQLMTCAFPPLFLPRRSRVVRVAKKAEKGKIRSICSTFAKA